MARNLQNYSRSEHLVNIKDILNRSSYEWLGYHDVTNIIELHLPLSTDVVEPFKEGLYLFPHENPTDANNWDFTEGRVTQQTTPLYYTSSRLTLDPLDDGMKSTYWRRIYHPGSSLFKVAHYISVHLQEDVLSSDDSGRSVIVEEESADEDEEDIVQPHNLQDDSESEHLWDIEEILNRSRFDWLNYDDVTNIMQLQVHLTPSTEMVEAFNEGLYLFDSNNPTDANEWDFTVSQVTQEAPPLYYEVSRLALDPVDQGIRSTYWRRVYFPPAGQFKLTHYLAKHMPDDASSLEGSGRSVTVVNSSSEEEESIEEGESTDKEELVTSSVGSSATPPGPVSVTLLQKLKDNVLSEEVIALAKRALLVETSSQGVSFVFETGRKYVQVSDGCGEDGGRASP